MYKLVLSNKDSNGLLLYDEVDHKIYDENGTRLTNCRPEPAGMQFQRETVWRVSFGKRCNFSCKYCIQPKVYEDQSFSTKLVENMIRVAGARGIKHVTMWGGEPALYMDSMKSFTEAIHRASPSTKVSTLSNGTILTDSNTDWLMDNDVYLTISWDGPGQHLRGPDVFATQTYARNFKRLYDRDNHEVSVNPVITRANFDFIRYVEHLEKTLGYLPFIGEAGALIVVDDSSQLCAVRDEDLHRFSTSAFEAFTKYPGLFVGASEQAVMWLHRLTTEAFKSPTRCCCTSPNSFSVDLEGNILVCQSFSKGERDEYGQPYCLGNLSDIEDGGGAPYYLPEAFLQYKKDHCSDCIVQHACRANCPYTASKYRDVNCKLLKAYYLAVIAYGLYMLTGDTLTEMEHMK